METFDGKYDVVALQIAIEWENDPLRTVALPNLSLSDDDINAIGCDPIISKH